jgi:membrane protease YdiL (CAAX protease family)
LLFRRLFFGMPADNDSGSRSAGEAVAEEAAFRPFAWRGWGLAVVFVAAVLALSASVQLARLALIALEHPEARDLTGLVEWYGRSLSDPDVRASLYGPVQLFSVVLIRSIAAVGTVYWLRGLLPADSMRALGFVAPSVKQIAFGAGIGLLAVLAGSAANFVSLYFFGYHTSPWTRILATHHGLTAYLLDILQGSVVSPIAEETLFRGLLFAGLAQRMPPIVAALISSTIFGLFHLTPYWLPALVTVGLVQAFVYYRTRNIWAAIVTHGVVNWIAFSLNFLHRS